LLPIISATSQTMAVEAGSDPYGGIETPALRCAVQPRLAPAFVLIFPAVRVGGHRAPVGNEIPCKKASLFPF
jgi:hypothetical protein